MLGSKLMRCTWKRFQYKKHRSPYLACCQAPECNRKVPSHMSLVLHSKYPRCTMKHRQHNAPQLLGRLGCQHPSLRCQHPKNWDVPGREDGALGAGAPRLRVRRRFAPAQKSEPAKN